LLLHALSAIEAQIDFSDIEEVNSLSFADARHLAGRALQRIRSALAASQMGERLRDGLNVVIAGPPNVGKSTLINAISKKEVSIVACTPGTTRDIIELSLDVNGYPVTLVDTAGIRDTGDPVELEGVNRARRRLREADLTLWLVECATELTPVPDVAGAVILVKTKSDQVPVAIDVDLPGTVSSLRISAQTGDGIMALLNEIGGFVSRRFDGSAAALITTERHKTAFSEAETALARLLDAKVDAAELIAEELRLAARAMERIAGRINVEDVLGAIFSRLCVGK
jgi:tRNA modification GTPase